MTFQLVVREETLDRHPSAVVSLGDVTNWAIVALTRNSLALIQIEDGDLHLHGLFGSFHLVVLLLRHLVLLMLLLLLHFVDALGGEGAFLLHLNLVLSLHFLQFIPFLLNLGLLPLLEIFHSTGRDRTLTLLGSPLVSLSFECFLQFEVLGARRLVVACSFLARLGDLLAEVGEVARHFGHRRIARTWGRLQDHGLAILLFKLVVEGGAAH